MKRLLLLVILVLSLCGCMPENQCNWPPNQNPVMHVLFIGNSYTYVNDLPGTFGKLACSGGHKVATDMAANGGWTLQQHAASTDTLAKLQGQKWDYVILQEQSEVPAVQSWRVQMMYPAARLLVAKIRQDGAKPIFFLTWGHKDGLPDNGLPDYTAMQNQLSVGYFGIANELNVPVAPVGRAWQVGRFQANPPDFWQSDGSHPTINGTYLAASVFYAEIFQQSPVGLAYTDGLDAGAAQNLQTLAANATLK
ncbi:MAG: hypothetical protein P4L50_28735 [Anaerolineaceae bacterium]|nr:hypothetical protein [Anaerolineaceae bacterium]